MPIRSFLCVLLLSFLTLLPWLRIHCQGFSKKTDSLKDFIYVITLDGVIYQVSLNDGFIQWSHNENKIIETQVPSDSLVDFRSILIPDPTDGSLHSIDLGKSMYAMPRKLPLTIPQLVRGSPRLSSEGVIQLGYKKDVWLELNVNTGQKLLKIDSNPNHFTCPEMGSHTRNKDAPSVILSRSEFSLILVSKENFKSFMNITYSLYSSYSKSDRLSSNYLFLSSTLGDLACLNSDTMEVLWKLSLDSLVVHLLSPRSNFMEESHITYIAPMVLRHLKVGSVAKNTLDSVLENKNSVNVIKRHSGTYYTVQSYDGDYQDALIPLREKDPQHALPSGLSTSIQLYAQAVMSDDCNSTVNMIAKNLFEYVNSISGSEQPVLAYEIAAIPHRSVPPANVEVVSLTRNYFALRSVFTLLVIIASTAVGYYLSLICQKVRSKSEGVSEGNPSEAVVSTIGKISFDETCILGRGCEGTFVFEGTFDNRRVAVKRILSSSMELANREIKLLRESDQHPNVIRYYCTEKDAQFFYIALELCSYNLHEYITDPTIDKCFNEIDLLRQTMMGLNYLHSLRIVHRDVKPHNVLIALPNYHGKPRALISDFGLCKKLAHDKSEFSHMTATFVGTQGWAAPEIYHGNHKITSSCDIFSMGCVHYFVLTKGSHPFGDELTRQSNINNNNCVISELPVTPQIYEIRSLILNMLSPDPSCRPSAEAVLTHPYYWCQTRRSHFIQDLGNYNEKLQSSHPLIQRIEINSVDVVRGSWVFHIPVNLQKDMLHHRSYAQSSVRDLVRAIRNKITHFKDSPELIRVMFDENSDNVVSYFSEIFPKLILHLYMAIIDCNLEKVPPFQRYLCLSEQFS